MFDLAAQPQTFHKTAVASLPHAVREKPSLRPEPQELKDVLADFGHELVMRASDECRVLPHILHLIGKGGEHVVFEDIRYPNYIVKIDFIESLPVLYAVAQGQGPLQKAVAELKDKAKIHSCRLRELQSYFPSGSVPLEIVAVKNIPLRTDVVLALMHDRNLQVPKKLIVPPSLPLLCTIQRRIILPKDKIDIYSSYSELNRTISLDYYAAGHRLLAGAEAIGPADREARNKIIRYIYPSLGSLMKKLVDDPNFMRALADYIRRAMRYTLDTGEIIDMAGGGNVMFFKNDDGYWQPFLMDVLSPPELNVELIHQTALLIKHGQDVDIHTKANTLNVLNYIRFANALAILSNITDRLEVRGMSDITPEQWHAGLMIEKYLDVYTPKSYNP